MRGDFEGRSQTRYADDGTTLVEYTALNGAGQKIAAVQSRRGVSVPTQISLDGHKYDYSRYDAATGQVIYQERQPDTIAVGQRYLIDREEEHILAQVNPRVVALIGLKSANRWSDPVQVWDIRNITPEEFDRIADGAATVERVA